MSNHHLIHRLSSPYRGRTLAAILLLILLLVLLSVNLTLAQSSGGTTRSGDPVPAASIAKADLNQLKTAAAQGDVRLIVGLDVDTYAGRSFRTLHEVDQLFFISGAQSTLLANLAAAGVTARNVSQFAYIPYMALTVDAAGLDALNRSPLVNYIQLDGLNFIDDLQVSTTQIGVNGAGGAWALGYDGTGWTVAVLDTGVDKNHEFLTGKVVSEACYGTNDTFFDPYFGTINVVSNCPGQATSSTASGSGLHCNADGCEHGTHVAGTAAGAGDDFDGVARGGTLIAVQVFSKITTSSVCNAIGYSSPCVTAFDSDIINALNRVYALRNDFDIASINLSLGGGVYATQAACDADNLATKAVTDKLKNAGIAVVAASGNDGYIDAMGAPACISGVISVGAVDSGDNVANFSNAASFLTLLAPGVDIIASVPGDLYASLSGTSMATPHVAGAWAVLKQYAPGASVNKIKKSLKKTGPKVQDILGKFPRIQVNEAIVYLTKPGKATLISPTDESSIHEVPATFEWSETDNTDLYRLIIKNSDGQTAFKEDLPPTNCTSGVCSYTLTEALPYNGLYKWYIQTYNQYNEEQSGKNVVLVDYPGAPTLTLPADDTEFASAADWVTLEWSEVASATAYKIVVKDKLTKATILKTTVDTSGCTSGACTYTVTATDQGKLKDGHDYKWTVTASNDLGKSKSDNFLFKARF